MALVLDEQSVLPESTEIVFSSNHPVAVPAVLPYPIVFSSSQRSPSIDLRRGQ